MHLGPTDASLLVHRLDHEIQVSKGVEVVLCAPFVDLYPLKKELPAKFKLGAQNLYFRDEGAFTGEISGPMLAPLVDYVIVGHSERRIYFEETDVQIADKLAAAYRNGLRPILCVGENPHDHDQKVTKKVVIDQIEAGLVNLTASEVKSLIIAYEPIWAIGTGKNASPDIVAPVAEAIHNTVSELYGASAGDGLNILYGGSVDAHNARAYLEAEGIDGLLVGSASLNYHDFGVIVAKAQAIAGE